MADTTTKQGTNEAAVILRSDTPIETAAAWAQSGKVDVGTFVEWCKHTRFELAAAVPLMMAFLSAADFAAVMSAQSKLTYEAGAAAGRAAGGGAGQLRVAVSKRGALSLYGVNTRMPVTLYAAQWERVLAWVKAPAENAIGQFIGTNPTATFKAEDYDSDSDKKFLDEVRAGKHASHKISGDKVIVTLNRKATE